MKKILFLLASVAMAACNMMENEAPLKPSSRLVDPEGVTIFRGTALMSTKIAAGEPADGHYKLVWEENDSLTVLNAADNTVLGKARLSSGAGQAEAEFTMEGTIADSTKVIMAFGELEAPAEQLQKAGAPGHLLASAVSDPVYIYKGQSEAFALKHKEAVVKVSVSAGKEFEGAALSAVILRSEGPALSDEGDYVRLSLENADTLRAGQQLEYWLAALPFETGSIYVAFELVSNEVSYTVPVAFEGCSIKAGSVTPFKVEGLARYMNVPWFKSFDLRPMPGIDYAYGDANCYFIQCKNGHTYNGATYIPNGDIPDEVAVSYRARGDFRKVIIPKGVSFTWMKLGATDPATGTGTGKVHVMRTTGFEQSGVDPTLFSFNVDPERYEVKVKNDGAYAGAPILLMVKDGKVLWAWSFWNIAADGTSIYPVLITNEVGKQIITMDLGQATRNGEAWGKNGSPDPLARTVFKYQWGRPVPVLWNSVTTLDIPGVQEGNVPAVVGPLSLEESMQHPASLIVASTEADKSIDDWLTTPRADLWGNNNSSLANIGVKTVFDPCPKGYRICDRYTLLNIVRTKATGWEIVSGDGYAFHNVTYPSGSDQWLRSGYLKSTTGTSFEKTSITGISAGTGGTNGFWWTNLCQGETDLYPSVYVAANQATLAFNDNWNACRKAFAASVRCEVDTTNR